MKKLISKLYIAWLIITVGLFSACTPDSIELEQEADKKADYAYSAAVVLFSKKQLSKAKQYATKLSLSTEATEKLIS